MQEYVRLSSGGSNMLWLNTELGFGGGERKKKKKGSENRTKRDSRG